MGISHSFFWFWTILFCEAAWHQFQTPSKAVEKVEPLPEALPVWADSCILGKEEEGRNKTWNTPAYTTWYLYDQLLSSLILTACFAMKLSQILGILTMPKQVYPSSSCMREVPVPAPYKIWLSRHLLPNQEHLPISIPAADWDMLNLTAKPAHLGLPQKEDWKQLRAGTDIISLWAFPFTWV